MAHVARETGTVKIAPMLARTASTEKGSTHSPIRINPPAPIASPVRRIVPRLPGSRSRSATSQMPDVARSSRVRSVGSSSNTPRTVCGLSLPDSFVRMSPVVSIASPPDASTARISAASSGCAVPDAKNNRRGSRPVSRASVRMRNPSARNRPASRRCRLSRRSRTSRISGLEKAVIVRGMSCGRRRISPRRTSPRRARSTPPPPPGRRLPPR